MGRGAVVLALLALSLAGAVDAKCSAQNCPKIDPNFYTVHIVPHSHMDLGWLKTVEQYFFGTKIRYAPMGVQYIYDSVLAELLKDEKKRFMFVETGFFELWWTHRDNATRDDFRRLVLNGQIELVSGGYVMNDEAAVHYMNTIDQMTYGLGILKELFGECGVSRVGWQIDPFGHSREFASLLAQMGFQGLYLGRIDYQDKTQREVTRTLEFDWKASDSLPHSRLTGVVLANNYSPPPGFCFDEFCDDDPIVEDPKAREYNGPERAKDLINWLRLKADFYATNNFLVTMGNDFNYQNAHKWMSNLDALMRLINGKGFKIHGLPVRLVYSTPSCYLAAIQDQELAVKSDDFFPYASDPHAYWSGYFTSRPAFKYIDRLSNNRFQATKQLAAMADLGNGRLNEMRRALAIGQHHDAITGTAKQHVNNDYTRMISIGLAQVDDVAHAALQKLATKPRVDFMTFCRHLNVSQCDELDALTEGEGLTVTAYNPASQKVKTYVRLPVMASEEFSVKGQDGKELPYDVLPVPDGVKNLAERSANTDFELVFPIEIDALSFTSVDIVKRQELAGGRIPWHYPILEVTEPRRFSRDGLQIEVDPSKGLTGLGRQGGFSINVTGGYYFYRSHDGNNSDFYNRASGAYIFRNAGPAEKLPLTDVKAFEGRTVTEVWLRYGDWVYESIRIGLGIVEIDWVVGPIPVADKVGKELIYRLDSEIDSGEEFFTDSNARENILRRRNFRPTWPLSLSEPVAGNYYPVNSVIGVKDQKNGKVLALLTDRSMGGSSLESGQLEVMLHRRCLYDDAFGVGEPLNEPGFDGKGLQIRGTFRVFVMDTPEEAAALRKLTLAMALKPILAFSSKPLSPRQSLIDPTALPDNVQLLSLEQTSAKTYLVRLENIYERRDNPKSATVDLGKLFGGRVSTVRETLLAANIDLASKRGRSTFEDRRFALYPMQIRTFFVTLA